LTIEGEYYGIDAWKNSCCHRGQPRLRQGYCPGAGRSRDHGRIDFLVNNAWGGYEIMVDFDPFWKIPLKHWDLMFTAGVRSHMLSSRFAVPLMIPQKKGLIVNTTAPVRGRYHGNVFYDTAKTAVNRMCMGMAHDLRTHGIAVIALAPGWMRTERVLQAMNTDEDNWTKVPEMEKTESPQYAGRAVLALAADEKVMEKTGQMHDVADLAREYGFKDIDGRQVPPIRELYPEYFAE
jgi:NAD(P)-dependent dehydrogenase (short-subunit alcohol dehydrogenase family)